MKANVTIGCYIQKVSGRDLSMTNVISASVYGTELGTSYAACNWTDTPSSTAFAKGDRIRIVPYWDDAGTMGNSYNIYFGYNHSGAYDSYVTFNETLSFMTFSGSQYLYPTNVASDVSTSDVDYKIWTSRGT